MPRRPLHLLIYPSAGGHTPAHWSLFIPSLPNRSLGKIIHAVGTPFTGYALVFKRNYNLETEERKVQSLWLCDVADEYVVDTPGDGGRMVEDVDAVDRLEEEAGRVVCPGVWKRPLDAFGGEGCQAWLKKYVAWLVQRKIVDAAALEVLENAPVV